MNKRRLSIFAVVAIVTSLSLVGTPAGADHTNPRVPQSPTEGAVVPAPVTFGEGTWRHIDNFPINPGTDVEFFQAGGEIYTASGTLGQGPEGHVGQRIVQLTANGGRTVLPTWEADHGSAACDPRSTSITGLQHDSQVTGYTDPELLIDTTDATGRCHDGLATNGGGLEFVDISDIQNASFEPREIHLTRMAGFSHTHTVDDTRPWVVYNSSSDFSGRPWIDVVDIRTCLGLEGQDLAQKRDACRPQVYRIHFQPDWSRQRNWYDGQLRPGSEAACHDITSVGTRIYCAALNATLIFDVANLTDPSTGAVRGRALPCTITNGTNTAAKVTDCSGRTIGRPQAEGWTFLGTFNHPGRDCLPPPGNNQSCNNNLFVRSDEGVSVSHEADPTHDGNHMFVTDERGGGVVPPGATCVAPGVDNPVGNGGIHTFDISDPSNIDYALTPDGDKAIWRSDIFPPSPTFCDVHVIEHLPGEQRLIVAYYSGGTKIVDYFIDGNGRFTFRETASIILPLANTWAVEDFKIIPGDLSGRTRTYFFVATDIQRGIDVLSWTGLPNPIGTPPPATSAVTAADAGLLGVVLVALPAAAWFGRRRRGSRARG